MWLFWVLAALLAAAAAGLVALRAAAASKAVAAGAEDPALPIYRRQLAEIDDLKNRGLLGEAEHRAALAEAGRRLLAQGDQQTPPERSGGQAPRLAVLGGIFAAGVGALALYLALGSPGLPDQPFKARMAAWRRANPTTLSPAELAAVLRPMVQARPDDPQGFEFLGRAQLASNQPVDAAESFKKALALSPGRADLQVLLGEAIAAAAEGQSLPPESEAAFRKALALDPKNFAARYFLARSQVMAGDRQAGLAVWRQLAAELAAGDPRRQLIESDIEKATGPGALGAAAAPTDPAAQQAFIRSMVASLAARLDKAPDDPQGWVRLVRAYRVLGDKAAEQNALDRARKLFAGRPDELSRIEAEAKAPDGSGAGGPAP